MLLVKIMSSQNMADDNVFKDFRLIQVGDKDVIHFGYPDSEEKRNDLSEKDLNSLFITRHGVPGFETYEMTGNVYIMNQNGKTIDSRGTNHYTAPT